MIGGITTRLTQVCNDMYPTKSNAINILAAARMLMTVVR